MSGCLKTLKHVILNPPRADEESLYKNEPLRFFVINSSE